MAKSHKILDYEPTGLSPWEQEDLDEAKKIKELQEDYIERERKRIEEETKKREIEEKKLTKKEERVLEVKADKIKKLYALDYWMRCFSRVSYHNEMAGQALFHVCLGQALNALKISLEDNSEIDWREHFLWIQNSGSGKGRAMNFANRVFSHPKFKKKEMVSLDKPPISRLYKTYKFGRLNAASMINTFERDKKGNIMVDDNDLPKINFGIIEGNDLLFSEEGRQFLEAGVDSFEKQEILMTGMETIGSINNIYTKQLTDYKTVCETRCTGSFIITTRPFGSVKKTLVESGLIPRFIFLPRTLTFEDREKMNRLSSLSFKTKGKKSSFSADFDELINELNKVVDFVHGTNIDFCEEDIDDLLSFLHDKMMWFTRKVEEEVPNDENRQILQSFVSRYKDNLVIMAFHSAAIRFSETVELEDLQYAFNIFKKLFKVQKT